MLLHQRVGHSRRDRALLDERTREDLAHGRMRGDGLVHQGLRERRLVPLVVAVAAVADEIDQEVEAEPHAVFPRQPRRLEARDRVVGVHVHDRNLEAPSQAAGVAGAVGLLRRGGEPELVVGDDVNRPAGVVPRQPRQVQRFGDDALPREGRVSVDEHGQREAAIETGRAGPADRRPGCARHADDHRIDRLQVARVRGHRHIHLAARRGGPRAGVVLHVARPPEVGSERPGRHRVLELGEDLRVRLVEHVRQHVQPAAVRHAEHRVTRAVVGGAADNLVEHGHEHVEPFDRKARLAGKRPMQEALEDLNLCDAVEGGFDAVRIHRRQEPARLGRVAEPLALCRHEHVRVVEARRPAIDAAELLDALERIGRRLGDGTVDERRRQVPEVVVRDAVGRGRKRGVADWVGAERIDARRQVAIAADTVCKIGCADDLLDVRPARDGLRAVRSRGRRRPGFEGRAGGRIDRIGVLPIAFVQLQDVAGIDALEFIQPHDCSIVT